MPFVGVYPWAMYNSPPFDVCTNFVDELPFFFDELGSELDIISATKNLTFPVGFFVGCINFFRMLRAHVHVHTCARAGFVYRKKGV